MEFYRDSVDNEKYVIATYSVSSSVSLADAGWQIAIGQSVGNPNVRNQWETEELFERNSCIIIGDEELLSSQKVGEVKIAFPVVNTDWTTMESLIFFANLWVDRWISTPSLRVVWSMSSIRGA